MKRTFLMGNESRRYGSLTQLAKAFPEIKYPCPYCPYDEKFIKGSDYPEHHKNRHQRNKKRKMVLDPLTEKKSDEPDKKEIYASIGALQEKSDLDSTKKLKRKKKASDDCEEENGGADKKLPALILLCQVAQKFSKTDEELLKKVKK